MLTNLNIWQIDATSQKMMGGKVFVKFKFKQKSYGSTQTMETKFEKLSGQALLFPEVKIFYKSDNLDGKTLSFDIKFILILIRRFLFNLLFFFLY